ncbi:MAG: response regulator [Clostridia bacterium]
MSNTPLILLIEDERAIVNFMDTVLLANQYRMLHAQTGREAIALISSHCPDVILLDLGLPDMDGIDVIKTVRQWTQAPIIVVSARTREKEKVDALDAGADDYVTKPFGTAELLARIRIALRHGAQSGDNEAPAGKFKNSGLAIDYDARRVRLDDEEIHLTLIEYKIVTLLAHHIGKVLTYDYIIRNVWGSRPVVDNQILRVNMANIRRKLEKNPAEPKYIVTETAIGYRMIDYFDE